MDRWLPRVERSDRFFRIIAKNLMPVPVMADGAVRIIDIPETKMCAFYGERQLVCAVPVRQLGNFPLGDIMGEDHYPFCLTSNILYAGMR